MAHANVIKYIDDNENKFITWLSNAVAVKSVSSDKKCRTHCVEMVKVAQKMLEEWVFCKVEVILLKY